MKKLFLGAVFCIAVLGATAQDVTFTTSCGTTHVKDCTGYSLQDMVTVAYIYDMLYCE